jgi:hypothetical protein
VALKEIFEDSEVEQMLLVCFNHKIKESLRCSELTRTDDLAIKYDWVLNNLFQRKEISFDTRFSELVKKLYKSALMIESLRMNPYWAKNVFKRFLDHQRERSVKRFKNEWDNTSYLDAMEGSGDEKEEGEI